METTVTGPGPGDPGHQASSSTPGEPGRPRHRPSCPASSILAGWRQVDLPVHPLFLTPLLGSVGAVAGDVGLQDVEVVCETVQQAAGETPRTKHFGPFVEGEVGGDQDGAPLVALAEDLEEQLRCGTGARSPARR